MKNIQVKNLLNNKYLSYWLWVFITLFLPIILIYRRYDLGAQPPIVQISLPLTIGILWTLIRFWSDISEAASTMKEGGLREICLATLKVGPYLLLYFVGVLLESFHRDFMYVITVLLLTQLLGVLCYANYKRLKRKELVERGYVNVLR